MRQNKNIALNSLATLAALSSLALAGAAQAATFGPVTTSLGAIRYANAVLQNQTGASNATAALTVVRCSGAVETPAYVMIGTAAIATTADYQIALELVSPTQTRVSIWALSTTCDITKVTFGNSASNCGFDMTRPSPGTPGSLTGSSPIAVTLVGSWTSSIILTNAVKVPATPVRGDLYSQMSVSFSSCFDAGDILQFTVDTDIVN